LDIIGALWHLLNFGAPAVVIGLFASLIAKLLWRRDMAGASIFRLWGWSAGLALAAALACLVVFGRDGKIAGYTAMVLASAGGLWWAGFARRK
jgi:hypothetical protein